MHEFLKLLVGDMSRFVPLPEFLEVMERNIRGPELVGDPVVLMDVI